jgi:hypothetical protein
MTIDQIITPWFACGGAMRVDSIERDGSKVTCCGYLDEETIIYIKWEDEQYAKQFEADVESETAALWIDEDEDGEPVDTKGIEKILIIDGGRGSTYGFKEGEAQAWLSDRFLPDDMFVECF